MDFIYYVKQKKPLAIALSGAQGIFEGRDKEGDLTKV
jgi:hypothetical protein